MFTLLPRNVLWLIALSGLFFVPALAQFEIAPDHFDSVEKKRLAQNVRKTEQPTTAPTVTVASGSAGAATIRDRHKGGPSAGQARQRLQLKKNMQGNLSGNQVAAARQKPSEKARTVATLQ